MVSILFVVVKKKQINNFIKMTAKGELLNVRMVLWNVKYENE